MGGVEFFSGTMSIVSHDADRGDHEYAHGLEKDICPQSTKNKVIQVNKIFICICWDRSKHIPASIRLSCHESCLCCRPNYSDDCCHPQHNYEQRLPNKHKYNTTHSCHELFCAFAHSHYQSDPSTTEQQYYEHHSCHSPTNICINCQSSTSVFVNITL